jgi:cell wall-associated NlpC family hydrolase
MLAPLPSTQAQSRKKTKRPGVVQVLKEIVEPWLGTPYHWGGGERGIGVDCSGFTKAVLEDLFVLELPHSSREQMRMGKAVKHSQLQPGDLVFFAVPREGRDMQHVGIYMGDGRFVHASRTRGVVYDVMRHFPGRYRGARRLIASESQLAAMDRKSDKSLETSTPSVPMSARDRGLLCLY